MATSRFEEIVMNIVGGVDLLEVWRIPGNRWWKRLFRTLVVICDGDPMRPLAHVALSLQGAARKIMDMADAEPRPMNIVPLEGSRPPGIVDSEPLSRRLPIMRNEPFTGDVIVVGSDWIATRIESLVPPIRKAVRWLRLYRYGDLPADLLVSPDFRALALEEYGRGMAATCSLDYMVQDMINYNLGPYNVPFYMKWTYEHPRLAVELLCRELDVFAFLVAQGQGLIRHPIWTWISERQDLPLKDDVQNIASSQGIVEALEYAVRELSLWSMARRNSR